MKRHYLIALSMVIPLAAWTHVFPTFPGSRSGPSLRPAAPLLRLVDDEMSTDDANDQAGDADAMDAADDAAAATDASAPDAAADASVTASNANVEPVDGTGNNIANPTWGSAGSDLLRIAPSGYADGIDAPSLPNDQSARVISNLLNDQSDPADPSQDYATIDQNSLADFGYAFGQFMDHDMDLTPDGGAEFDIPVPAGDPIGPDPLDFTRSITDPNIPANQPAQQVNVITSYLDLSQVYGSSQEVASALRTLTGGLLKTSPGNMLPFDNVQYFTADQIAALNMANDAHALPEDDLFAAGDVRANENVELTALETLFVRNHNRLAGILAANHPGWTDEALYQEARKLNIAQYQNIVYSEWVPGVFGAQAMPQYRGYNPRVDAAIANEFSTVAFRFGHSMVSPDIEREGDDGMEFTDSIPLEFDFFDPNLLNPNGVVDPLTGLVSTDIGPILKADADGNGQCMDMMAIGAVRNLLFGDGGLGGDDLIARDVQRGRDNGIPDYNTLRKAYGLRPMTTFAQVVAGDPNFRGRLSGQDAATAAALAQAYPGGVNTIDAFEGGLAEHAVNGSEVGPLFQAIMVDQFHRLRDGDRFFYLNEGFNREEAQLYRQANTLGEVIAANTEITNLQDDVMIFSASISGTVIAPMPSKFASAVGGVAGITMVLQDVDGDVLATTTTDGRGRYSFDEQSGPAADSWISPGVSATGVYVVVPQLPATLKLTSQPPAPIAIDAGDEEANGINFIVVPVPTPTPPHRNH